MRTRDERCTCCKVNRAQAREIARLQREVVDAHRERDALAGEVMKPLDVRFKDCVRDLIRETTWFRLRSVEETIEVNAYEAPRARV